MNRVPAAVVTLLVLAPSGLAHEGHGNPSWLGSALHYLIEPAHLSLTLGAVAALALASGWATTRRLRRAARARRR